MMRTIALLLAIPSAAAISCYQGGGYEYTGSCGSVSDTNTATTYDCGSFYDYCGLLDIDMSNSNCAANFQFGFCGSDTYSASCSDFTVVYTDDAVDSVGCTSCTTDNCNTVDPDASGLSTSPAASKPVAVATTMMLLLAAGRKLA